MIKKIKLIPVLSITLASIILLSTLSYAFIPTFRQALRNTFITPQEQLSNISTKYVESLNESLSQSKKLLDSEVVNLDIMNFNGSITLTPGDYVNEQSGTTIKPITMKVSSGANDLLSGQDISYFYADKKIVSLRTLTDFANSTSYISLPELSSNSYLSLSYEDLESTLYDLQQSLYNVQGYNDYDDYDYEYYDDEYDYGIDETYGLDYEDSSLVSNMSYTKDIVSNSVSPSSMLMSMYGGIPSLESTQNIPFELIEKSLQKYTNIIVDNIPNVKRSTGVKGEVKGIDYNYTCLSFEINEKDALEISIAVIKEAAKDNEIANYAIENGLVTDKDTYKQVMNDLLKELEEDNEDYYDNEYIDETTVDFKLFVNSSDDLMGVEMTVNDGKYRNEIASGGFICTENGKDIAYESWVSEAGATLFEATFKGTQVNNSISGDLEFRTFDSEPLSIIFNFNNFEIVNEEKGLINGDIKMTCSDGTDNFEVNFSGRTDGKSQDISFDSKFNNKSILGITTKYEPTTEGFNIGTVPDAGSNQIFEMNDIYAVEEYLATLDVDAFLETLDQEIIDLFMSDLDGITVPDFDSDIYY